MTEIVGIAISSIVTLLICIINNNAQAKRSASENQITLALIKNEISALKDAQAKHNSVIERVYHLEQVEKVNDTKFEMISEQIKEMRKENK